MFYLCSNSINGNWLVLKNNVIDYIRCQSRFVPHQLNKSNNKSPWLKKSIDKQTKIKQLLSNTLEPNQKMTFVAIKCREIKLNRLFEKLKWIINHQLYLTLNTIPNICINTLDKSKRFNTLSET